MNLGVLDFCLIQPGQSARDGLLQTVQLAGEAERLGYKRFWLGEHHGVDCAMPVPEVVVPLVAGTTETLVVGGTSLLQYHSVIRVAETYKTLEAVFPGRIELLVGRGRPPAHLVQHFTARAASADEREPARRVRQLGEFLGDAPDRVPPLWSARTPIWILTTSGASARAARPIDCLSVGLLFSTLPDPALARQADRPPGRVNIAIAGICAPSRDEAHRLLDLTAATRRSMVFQPRVIGSPVDCRDELLRLAGVYGVDEVMFMDLSPTYESRLTSLRLLAEAVTGRLPAGDRAY